MTEYILMALVAAVALWAVVVAAGGMYLLSRGTVRWLHSGTDTALFIKVGGALAAILFIGAWLQG